MRHKLIISSNVQPGPLWQQIVCVGREALQAGYGSVNFEAWVIENCPPDHKLDVQRSFQNDNAPYMAANPFEARIYKVHPDTYATRPAMNNPNVDVFQEHTITLTNGTQYTFELPAPLKKP